MIAFLTSFVHVLVSPFKTQAQLEAEIVILRHPLNALRRRLPSKPKLTVADRLLALSLVSVSVERDQDYSAGDRHSVASDGLQLYWRWKSRSRGGRLKIPGKAANSLTHFYRSVLPEKIFERAAGETILSDGV